MDKHGRNTVGGPMISPDKKLLSLTEMADYLAVTPRTLTKYVTRYQIPHVKIGVLLRFDRDRVIEHLEARNVAFEPKPLIQKAVAPKQRPRGQFAGVLSRSLPEIG